MYYSDIEYNVIVTAKGLIVRKFYMFSPSGIFPFIDPSKIELSPVSCFLYGRFCGCHMEKEYFDKKEPHVLQINVL